MFTLNPENTEATLATEGENLVTKPVEIASVLNLAQMNAYAEKYVGEKFAKGTTKAAACDTLFTSIANKLGVAEDEVKKVMEAVAEEKKPAAKKKSGPRKQWSKTYKLLSGKTPVKSEDGKLEVIWGDHADVITEAIMDLKSAGKEVATRDEIMNKAVELGLYERRKSTQGIAPIFSWWRKSLFTMGWIDTVVEGAVAEAASGTVAETK